MIEARECQISIERRPAYCDRGNYIAKLFPRARDDSGRWVALSIDAAGGWPRYYFDFDRMLAELEAWLVKRGQMTSASDSIEEARRKRTVARARVVVAREQLDQASQRMRRRWPWLFAPEGSGHGR